MYKKRDEEASISFDNPVLDLVLYYTKPLASKLAIAMQFTTFITLFATLAAKSVHASPLEQRRAPVGTGYIHFYADMECTEPFVKDTIFTQGDKCLSNQYTGPYGSFKVQENGFTRTGKLAYDQDCAK